MELLKQPAYQVIPHELIVLSLYLSEHNWIDELEVEQVRPFERYMQEAFTNNHADLLEELAEDYELTEDLQHRIDEVLEDLLEEFKVMQMAENIKTIQLRMNTINKVSKITNAMKLVSMSKLQRYQRKVKEFEEIVEEYAHIPSEKSQVLKGWMF